MQASLGRDYYLVETRINLKLKRSLRKGKGPTRFDTQKLADKEIRFKYNIEVRNRFQVLKDLDEVENAEQMNLIMENIYAGAAKDVLGVARRTSRKP